MSQWYFAVQKEKRGPVTAEQIRAYIADGVLTAGTPVWTNGLSKWVRLDATDFRQFFQGPPSLVDEHAHAGGQRNITFDLKGVPEKFEYNKNAEFGVGLNKANLQAIGHVAKRTNVLAFTGIVLAILGFFTGITAIPAVVCGHIALSHYRRDPEIGGDGMAKAALIMGYLVIGAFAFIVLLVFAFMLVAVATHR